MSDTRFGLLEIDGFTAPVAEPEPVAAPVVRGKTINAEGAARSLEDEAAAKAAGFSPAPPIYTVGTMVVDLGVENFKQSRREFESQALVAEACDSLATQVKAEARRDLKVKVPTLKYLLDGSITGPDLAAPLPLSERAFEGLCNLVTPGGSTYLKNCGQVGEHEAEGLKLRADNMNHWFPRAIRLDKRGTKKALKKWAQESHARLLANLAPEPKPVASTFKADQEVKLRIRKSGEGEEVFSTVGPRYSAFDVDCIAEAVKEACGDMGGRCTVVYNGYKAQIDILFHSNIVPENCVAGEFFKAGIRITTADDGTGAIKVQSLVYRNLCLNLIIIDVAKSMSMKRRHIGAGIAEAVAQGIEDAKRRVSYFSNKWSEANLENVLERYGLAEPQEVFERLVANKVVHVPGYNDTEMVERLLTAYATEPGYTKASFVNAVTKAAHHHGWNSMDDVASLEEKGGELLFAKVWNMAAPVTDEAQLLG
jgi:hypothetical protein